MLFIFLIIIFGNSSLLMTLLITNRLHIDFATTNDATFLHKLMNDSSYLKYIGDRNINSISDAENFITSKFLQSYKDNGYGYYIIKLKDTNQSIGICGLVNREALHIIDIGFALLPKFRKNNYAFEASKALYDYSQNILKIEEITAIVDPKNKKSISLLKKLGLDYKKMIQLDDDPIECMLFTSLKEQH